MSDQSMPKAGTGKNGFKLSSGNIASPVQETVAESEWQTEDFMAAEPYPLPEVTDEIIEEFLQN